MEKQFRGKTVFARTDLGEIDLAKNICVGFDNFFTEENVAKKVEEKRQISQAKKKLRQKLSQKLQKIPTKNRYKFQNNSARAASGARPQNGATRSAHSPIFGVVVLIFEFCLLDV